MDFDRLKSRLGDAFLKADTAEVIRILTDEFPDSAFSLRTLFRDEQRKIVNIILNDSLGTAAAAYRAIYENQAPLIRFLSGLGIPIPMAFQSAAEIALNNQLRQAFQRDEIDIDSIQSYIKEASVSRVALDTPGLEYGIRKRLEKEAAEFASQPTNIEGLQRLNRLLDVVGTLPFPVTLWEVQNICYGPLIKAMRDLTLEAAREQGAAKTALAELGQLRDKLRIRNS